MGRHAAVRFGSRRRVLALGAATLVVTGALAGCADVWREMQGDFGPVRLGPGVTRACYKESCNVQYTPPVEAAEYTVRANGQVVGTVAGGQPLDVGSYTVPDSPVTITADGADRSAAVLFVFVPPVYPDRTP